MTARSVRCSDEKPIKRRKPAAQRRAEMAILAAELFARHGLEIGTRDLAEAMGVTQALIYRHFGSKDGLIDAALNSTLGNAGPASRRSVLFDRGLALEDRLGNFYTEFVANATETQVRLFMRAGLDGRHWPKKRGAALTGEIFVPIVAGLREAAELPTVESRPLMRGERELVMMLHASMVFLGIRRHVYGMPMPENLDDIVRLYVTTFVAGALSTLHRLHETGEASLILPPPSRQSVSAPDRSTKFQNVEREG